MTTATGLDQPSVGALIGLLAVLEGSVRSGDLPLDQGLRLRRRLIDVGVLAEGEPYTAFADALLALNHRVRSLEAPGSGGHPSGPVESVHAFADEAAADSFAAEMQARGRDVDLPVPEPGYRRWTVAVQSDREARPPVVGLDAIAAIERGGWHLGAS
jgi:hypothetical protein